MDANSLDPLVRKGVNSKWGLRSMVWREGQIHMSQIHMSPDHPSLRHWHSDQKKKDEGSHQKKHDQMTEEKKCIRGGSHHTVVHQHSAAGGTVHIRIAEITLRHPCHRECPVEWELTYIERSCPPSMFDKTRTFDRVVKGPDGFVFYPKSGDHPPLCIKNDKSAMLPSRVVLLLSDWAKVCDKK